MANVTINYQPTPKQAMFHAVHDPNGIKRYKRGGDGGWLLS